MKRVGMLLVFCGGVFEAAMANGQAGRVTLNAMSAVLLPADTSDVSALALHFELPTRYPKDGIPIHVYLEWTVSDRVARSTPEFSVHEIMGPWTAEAVGEDRGAVAIMEDYADSWAIGALDFKRNGGFVRLDVSSLARAWASGEKVNYGLALLASNVTRTQMTEQVGLIRMVIWCR